MTICRLVTSLFLKEHLQRLPHLVFVLIESGTFGLSLELLIGKVRIILIVMGLMLLVN